MEAVFDAKTRMNSWFGAIFSPEPLKIGLFTNRLSEIPIFIDILKAREIRADVFPFWPEKIVLLNIHRHPNDLIGLRPSLFRI